MAIPTFKSFISEKELEEVKKKKQEEWERVRKPDQPLERPQETYDPRTLYERLKQQKDQKQEEWEEQFKFKNMIYKGLDDDEATFLTLVSQKQADYEEQIIRREIEEVRDYREAVARLHDEEQDSTPTADTVSTSTDPAPLPQSSPPVVKASSSKGPSKPQKSQLALIAGSIKTKRKRNSSTDDADIPDKKAKVLQSPEESKQEVPASKQEAPASKQEAKQEDIPRSDQDKGSSGGLLGLMAYSSSDSSDTE